MSTDATGPGRAVGRRTSIIPIPAVLDPLPDIAVHVVKTKGVRGVTADGLSFQPSATPSRLRRVKRVSPMILRRRPGTSGVFPLNVGYVLAFWLQFVNPNFFVHIVILAFPTSLRDALCL